MPIDVTEVSTVVIDIQGEPVEFDEPVELAVLNRLVREAGIRKYTIKDADGRELTPDDFPLTAGTYTVERYAQAA